MDEMERSSISSTIAASSIIGSQYLMLHVQFCAPDDGRRNRSKHVEHFVEINKSRNTASCCLYFGNIPKTFDTLLNCSTENNTVHSNGKAVVCLLKMAYHIVFQLHFFESPIISANNFFLRNSFPCRSFHSSGVCL